MDRIERLQTKEQPDDEWVRRSIGIINQLQNIIFALKLERRAQRVTIYEDYVEYCRSAGLGLAVQSTDLLTPNTASTVTKFDSSAPLNSLEEGNKQNRFPSKASQSMEKAIDARQVAKSTAQRR